MKLVFDGKKLKVYAGDYVTPSGKTVYREYIDFGESVAIIAVKDNGKILILKQFRMPTGKWIYEIPAGTVEKGEKPEECAYRELIEETGYEAGEIKYLFSMYLSPGYSNEYMHVYLAKKLRFVGARPEEGEEIKVEEKSANDVLDMIKNNLIRDSKSIASLLYYLYYLYT
jgi:ADP-ribose pyrophosphatase